MARTLEAVSERDDGTPSPAPTGDLPLLRVDRRNGQTPQPGRRWRWQRLLVVPLLMLLVATGGVIGLYFQPPGVRIAMDLLGLEPGAGTTNPIAVSPTSLDSREAATIGGPELVVALGVLLPESDVITIAPPFGAGDARIATVQVNEGDRVEAKEVLAVLDSAAQLEAAVDAARADVAVLEATLAERKAAIRASRQEAEAALARAEAAAGNARRELERTEALVAKGVVSEAVADAARATAAGTEQEVEQARAALSKYLTEDIDEQPDVMVAARNVDAARAALRRAERQAEAALIRAPIAGTVLTIHALPGERPGAEGILNLGNIDRMMAEVEVYETEVGAIEPGQPVEITAEALPRPLSGRVAGIGLEVGRQALVAGDPAASTDARVVEVMVALDEPSSEIASRFTNLQVTARIRTGALP
jgi:HlyD family secretion protein